MEVVQLRSSSRVRKPPELLSEYQANPPQQWDHGSSTRNARKSAAAKRRRCEKSRAANEKRFGGSAARSGGLAGTSTPLSGRQTTTSHATVQRVSQKRRRIFGTTSRADARAATRRQLEELVKSADKLQTRVDAARRGRRSRRFVDTLDSDSDSDSDGDSMTTADEPGDTEEVLACEEVLDVTDVRKMGKRAASLVSWPGATKVAEVVSDEAEEDAGEEDEEEQEDEQEVSEVIVIDSDEESGPRATCGGSSASSGGSHEQHHLAGTAGRARLEVDGHAADDADGRFAAGDDFRSNDAAQEEVEDGAFGDTNFSSFPCSLPARMLGKDLEAGALPSPAGFDELGQDDEPFSSATSDPFSPSQSTLASTDAELRLSPLLRPLMEQDPLQDLSLESASPLREEEAGLLSVMELGDVQAPDLLTSEVEIEATCDAFEATCDAFEATCGAPEETLQEAVPVRKPQRAWKSVTPAAEEFLIAVQPPMQRVC